MNNNIYINIASIPERMHLLEIVINCLYGQSTAINVYLNNYKEIPVFLKRPGINIATSEKYGDLGDAGKFFWSDKVEGYYLTADDDIIYPNNYVDCLIKGIQKYNNEIPVGIHGEIYPNIIKKWTFDRIKTYHFSHSLSKDSVSCILGTGCLGYHTSNLKVSPEDFPIPNMADVWFAVICEKQNKPKVVLARPEKWLKPINIPFMKTLWGKTFIEERINKEESKEVREIQICLPWKNMNFLN